MNEKSKHHPATDALGYLAQRKIQSQEERIKEQEEILQNTAFEALILKVQKRPLTVTEPKQLLDTLGEFIRMISISQKERKDILDIFRRELPIIPEEKPTKKAPIINQKSLPKVLPTLKITPATKNKTQIVGSIRGIFSSLKGLVDADILSRFPTAYKNYKAMPQDIRDSIYRLSRVFGLNHTQVLGLIANESHFRYDAISPVGASGPMQFMPTTRTGLTGFLHTGSTKNAGPEERFFAALRGNTDFMKIYKSSPQHKDFALGIAYLGYLTERYGTKALRVYNGGINFPNNKENMDYTRRVLEFNKAFSYILHKEDAQYAQK